MGNIWGCTSGSKSDRGGQTEYLPTSSKPADGQEDTKQDVQEVGQENKPTGQELVNGEHNQEGEKIQKNLEHNHEVLITESENNVVVEPPVENDKEQPEIIDKEIENTDDVNLSTEQCNNKNNTSDVLEEVLQNEDIVEKESDDQNTSKLDDCNTETEHSILADMFEEIWNREHTKTISSPKDRVDKQDNRNETEEHISDTSHHIEEDQDSINSDKTSENKNSLDEGHVDFSLIPDSPRLQNTALKDKSRLAKGMSRHLPSKSKLHSNGLDSGADIGQDGEEDKRDNSINSIDTADGHNDSGRTEVDLSVIPNSTRLINTASMDKLRLSKRLTRQPPSRSKLKQDSVEVEDTKISNDKKTG